MLLGRRDLAGGLVYIGRTQPLKDAHHAELRGALQLLGSGRQGTVPQPWPQPLPANWLGSFRGPAQPLRYLAVEPDVVAELEVDTSYENILVGDPPRTIDARFRHPPVSSGAVVTSRSLTWSWSYGLGHVKPHGGPATGSRVLFQGDGGAVPRERHSGGAELVGDGSAWLVELAHESGKQAVLADVHWHTKHRVGPTPAPKILT